MQKYNSFNELLADIEKNDSYWSQKAILDFSIELHNLMTRRNLSKKDLAEELGTTQAYITKVFRGKANFTIESMVRLTRAIGGDLNIHITPKEEEKVTWYRVVSKPKDVTPRTWGSTLKVDDYKDEPILGIG